MKPSRGVDGRCVDASEVEKSPNGVKDPRRVVGYRKRIYVGGWKDGVARELVFYNLNRPDEPPEEIEEPEPEPIPVPA